MGAAPIRCVLLTAWLTRQQPTQPVHALSKVTCGRRRCVDANECRYLGSFARLQLCRSPRSSADCLCLSRCLGTLPSCSSVEACGNCRPSDGQRHYCATCMQAQSHPNAAHAGLGLQPRSHADLCGTVVIAGPAEPHPQKVDGESGRKSGRKSGWKSGRRGKASSTTTTTTKPRCAAGSDSLRSHASLLHGSSPTSSPQDLGKFNFPTRPSTCSLVRRSGW